MVNFENFDTSREYTVPFENKADWHLACEDCAYSLY